MSWIQLTFFTRQETIDDISDFVMELGALSMTFEDAEDNPILEPAPGETPLWNSLKVSALFNGDFDSESALAEIKLSPFSNTMQRTKFDQLEDKDWEREWMDNFRPIQFGQRLWIVPSWHDAPDPNAVNILLDPGLAFGTGTHATTSLCLQWMDAHIKDGDSVLDYGCGSGILAIAAAKLGASEIVAVDIDPQAIVATRDNLNRNGLSDKGFEVGLPEILDDRCYDIVVANILAGPLQSLAETLASKVKVGGYIVLSGLLKEQAEEISQSYQEWFQIAPATLQEDWARIDGVKKQ